jgi:hypothetical protein
MVAGRQMRRQITCLPSYSLLLSRSCDRDRPANMLAPALPKARPALRPSSAAAEPRPAGTAAVSVCGSFAVVASAGLPKCAGAAADKDLTHDAILVTSKPCVVRQVTTRLPTNPTRQVASERKALSRAQPRH